MKNIDSPQQTIRFKQVFKSSFGRQTIFPIFGSVGRGTNPGIILLIFSLSIWIGKVWGRVQPGLFRSKSDDCVFLTSILWTKPERERASNTSEFPLFFFSLYIITNHNVTPKSVYIVPDPNLPSFDSIS